jgi:hypothetical protein
MDICRDVKGCVGEQHEYGSYCKYWQKNAVCYGLYKRPEGGYCFITDETCHDSYVPVSCHEEETTTQLPYTSTEYIPPTIYATTPKYVPPETSYYPTEAPYTTTQEAYTTTEYVPPPTKAPCHTTEEYTTTQAAYTSTEYVPPTDYCMDLCKRTPRCQGYNKEYGSYCKNDLHVPVCFGILWKDEAAGETCFHPNDLIGCSDKNYPPVKC